MDLLELDDLNYDDLLDTPLGWEESVSWTRHDRQVLYATILKARSSAENRMTPSDVKIIVQNEYGLTFTFVGQDMSAMRQSWVDVIGVANRGEYWWKDPTVEVARPRRKKSRVDYEPIREVTAE